MQAQVSHGLDLWIGFLVTVVTLAATWKVFVKAGEPGWACLVPIYNLMVLLKIAGKPTWWVILMMLPIVNIVVFFMVMNGIARAFGGGTGTTLGLLILGCVYFCFLGFGDAEYRGAPLSL